MSIQRPRGAETDYGRTLDVARLAQGVSRQPPPERFPGQVEEALNVQFDMAAGIRKRPGTRFDRKLIIVHGIPLVAGGNYRLHPINRDATEQYLVLYGDTEIKVFDLVNGDQATVTAVGDAASYPDLNTANADAMRLVTVEDTTLVLNTTAAVVTRASAAFTTTAAWRDHGVMVAQTPTDATYHRAMEDEAVTAEEAGYWKYDVGGVTFATAVFPEFTGGNTEPGGLYDDFAGASTKHQGFIIRFQRLPLTVAGATFTTATKTLTKAAAFTNYVFVDGDAIRITGGTGVATGWYRVARRVSADAVVLEMDIGGANPANVTADSIGLQCEVDYRSDQPTAADMYEVAAHWTAALARAGAANAVVSWRTTRAGYGSFTITGPYRGSNATILDPAAPASGTDNGAAATDPFYRTGVVITAGVGTAGAGTNTPDTLPVDSRWTRRAAPDDPKAALDERTMPIKLFRTVKGPGAKFNLDHPAWNTRLSGDSESNPPPSLWTKATAQGAIIANTLANPTVVQSTAHGRTTGQTVSIIGSNSTPTIDGNRVVTVIDTDHFSVPVNVSVAGTDGTWFYGAVGLNDLTIARNRLFFGGADLVVASQSGDLYNFFKEKASDVLDSDPIDITVSEAAFVDWLVPHNKTLVVFTRPGRQYELASPEALTPATAALEATTAIEAGDPTAGLQPRPGTQDLMFIGPTTRSAALWAYSYDYILQTQSADDVSQHVPDYLPATARTLVTAPNYGLTFLLKADDYGLYVYRTSRKGNQTQQAAWGRWTFDPTYRIVDIAVVGKNLWLMVEEAATVSVAAGGSPVTLTYIGHGLIVGNTIRLIDSNTAPSVDGAWTVNTVIDADHFTILVAVTTAGTARLARGVYYFEKVTLSREITRPADGAIPAWPYPVHLDRQMYLLGVYNAGGNYTAWTLPSSLVGDGSTLNRMVPGPAFPSYASKTITAISKAVAAVVTTSVAHGFTTNDGVTIGGTDSSPVIDGNYPVTVLSATTFSVPVDTSAGAVGTTGTVVRPGPGSVYGPFSVYGSTDVRLPGRWDAGLAALGCIYAMSVRLSTPFLRDDQGEADLQAYLLSREIITSHSISGSYSVRIDYPAGGPSDVTTAFAPPAGTGTQNAGTVFASAAGDSANFDIYIESSDPRPVAITKIQHAGEYAPRPRT